MEGEFNQLGIVQEIKSDRTNKSYLDNQNPSWRMKRINFSGYRDTDRPRNLGQTTRPSDNQLKKKRTCQIVDFAVSAEHRVKKLLWKTCM